MDRRNVLFRSFRPFLLASFLLGCQGMTGILTAAENPPVTPEVRILDNGGSLGGGCGTGDILVGDDPAAEELYCDMVSSSSGGYFLVVEYGAPSTKIDVFRSADGGSSWWLWAEFTGETDKITEPALAVPELDEDYIYVIYSYGNLIQVARIELSTGTTVFHNIDSSSFGVHRPRITTDNIDYPGNYWLYVTYVKATSTTWDVKVARSEDDAENWESYAILSQQSSFMPSPDITFAGGNLYAVYDRIPQPGECDVQVNRSTDLGTSWESADVLTDGTSESCFHPRIGAVQNGDAVVVVYTKRHVRGDDDIWYGWSSDGGATWDRDWCLDCPSETDENRADITVDPSLGDFHVTWNRSNDNQDTDILYTHTPHLNPTSWSAPSIMNDTGEGLSGSRKPVAVDWASGGAGVAWPDTRTFTSAVFFDRNDWEPSWPLHISIYPRNGQVFGPGDQVFWGVYLTNHSSSPVQVTASIYGSNLASWRYNLFGPLSFTIPGETMLGPYSLNAVVPGGAPPMNAYICAEANDAHDCYPVTIE